MIELYTFKYMCMWEKLHVYIYIYTYIYKCGCMCANKKKYIYDKSIYVCILSKI